MTPRLQLLPALVVAVVAGCSGSAGSMHIPGPGTSPPTNKIQHVVIMVQENRSFNNLFAGFPGANTAMRGRCEAGPRWCRVGHEIPLQPRKLAEGSPRLGGRDICHSHQCFEIECDPDPARVCRDDGFDLIDFGEVQAGRSAKLYPYSYVRRSESETYWRLAKQYALSDEMFFTETASSFIAHQMLISGSVRINDRESLTDQPNAMPWGCDVPPGAHTPILTRNGHYDPNGPRPCFTYATIAELLDAANVSWRYYVDVAFGVQGDLSGSAWNGYRAIKKIFYGPDWKTDVSTPNTTIFADIKAGSLPAVSWVIPSLADSDHPASGCNGGPWWVTKVVNALGTSTYWKNTAIVLLWDDWGGWYDNAPPAQINYTSLSFRVPMIVISPFAKPGYVSHAHYDFGSILKLLEQTFDLGSLGVTDATAASMEDVFNFAQRPNRFETAPLPPVMSCGKLSSGENAVHEIIERDGGVPE
ncbi:MAG: alkaline phosphatase family protein [Candidatus Cybelea sp.]